MAQHILILDDSELIVSMLTMLCAQLGYGVISATSLEDIPGVISGTTPHAILCDLNIPGVTDPVASVRAIPALAKTPIVLVSGISQDELDAIAEERGADAAISKDGGMPGMMATLGPTLSILLAG